MRQNERREAAAASAATTNDEDVAIDFEEFVQMHIFTWSLLLVVAQQNICTYKKQQKHRPRGELKIKRPKRTRRELILYFDSIFFGVCVRASSQTQRVQRTLKQCI